MTDQKLHSKLGPSGAKRWSTCSGSVKFIESLPEHLLDTTSEFSEEGTEAHDLCDKHLKAGTNPPATWEFEPIQVYLDEVRSYDNGFADIYSEERVYITDEIWGTSDAIIVDDIQGLLVAIDYKHGIGVPVEIEENEQLMCYALGALKKYDPERKKIKTVKMVIVQPRCAHEDGPVRRWETSAERLYLFEAQITLAAAATRSPNAPIISGKHCKFCPAVAACPAYKKALMEGMNNPALAHALEAAEQLGAFKAALYRVAHNALMSGKSVEGLKLVESKTHRKWIDPGGVSMLLKDKPEAFKNELKTPAQIEKIMGKDWVSCHAMKPKGNLQVASENDKRRAVSKGSHDFDDIKGEEG